MLKAIFLDFDGVILDTAKLKTEAYLRLYPRLEPQTATRVRQYCNAHGGVPRSQKLQHIQSEILGEPVSLTRLAELCDAFAKTVADQVMTAPFISGAKEFLEANHHKFFLFIISGTPHSELNEICQTRGLSQFFAGIAGSPPCKEVSIRQLMAEYRLNPTEALMVGDSFTDWTAARDTGLTFVGVGDAAANFLPHGTDIIPDLRRLASHIDRVSKRSMEH